MADLFFTTLDSIELRPEQKPVVEGIENDLEKVKDAAKEPRQKLVSDVADGVAAGKIDKAKTDGDIKALGNAIAATTPTVQDAMNRLYKTLDADQRKKLVDTLRERTRAMEEHMGHGGMMGPGEHGMMGPGEHGSGEHGMMGPGHGMGPEHGPGGGAMGPGHGMGPGGNMGQGGMGPGGGMMGHEHGMEHGGMEHGGMGPGMGMHGGPVEMLAQDLALTDDQKEKLRTKFEALRKTHEGEMKAKMEEGKKHLQAVFDAFAGDKFDAKKAGVATQGPELVKAMAKHRVEFAQTVLAVLTPEQRPKFAEHIRAHGEDPDMGPPPNGG
jgi:Spy/CpxP family protein refolding chaperone